MTDTGADPHGGVELDDAGIRRMLSDAAPLMAAAAGLDDTGRARLAEALPLLAGPVPPPAAGPGPIAAAPTPDPGALGRLHQELLAPVHRHRHGVHYTPAPTAALVGGRALDRWSGAQDRPGARWPTVCDPSCGGGVFLLAAADRLRAAGAAPTTVVASLHGVDLDLLAVEVTRTELVLWAARAGVRGDDLDAVVATVLEQIVVGDALEDPWPAEGRIDVVVGNPPFGGQLARSTARDRDTSRAARRLLGGRAAGYADTAGLFLVRAVTACAPGAGVAMLQPLSFLGARDAGAVRRRIEELAVLEEVWLADERLFGADVDVCAPFVRVADPLAAPHPSGPVVVTSGTASGGVDVDRGRLATAGSWAPVVAAATGVPLVALGDRARLGSRARSTAGFRDEFYALAPFVDDLADPAGTVDPTRALPVLPPGRARLVTAGLVEPGRTVWGRRTTRLAGTRLGAPVVDVGALRASARGPGGDRRLEVWADARLRPKVVVATQTRVVEAAVDDDGSWWPSVPVISVVLDPDHDDDEQRWLVAAALSAPPVSAWAAERSGGTALAPQALKLSARQVAEVPLPLDHDAWTEGAHRLRLVAAAADDAERARLLAGAGRALTAAHALSPPAAEAVLRWWAARAGCADDI